MHEVQRQAYLSSLGIENYAPRWLLPAAPVPVACVMPVVDAPITLGISPSIDELVAVIDTQVGSRASPPNLLTTIADLEGQKRTPSPINAATILQQLDVKKTPVVPPFSLSIYRPAPGILIVDSRNTTLALPTELLLSNILRAQLKATQFTLGEEVLRWPMIENRFVSRTENDARNELQTWLAVEHELRPIQTLWLMGENAARYWLDADSDCSALCWTLQPVKDLPLMALILPSLNQLLQNPAQKSKLCACLS
jgi:hypothetical protein